MGGKKTKNIGTSHLQKVQEGLQVLLMMLISEEENKAEEETEQDEPTNCIFHVRQGIT